MEVREEVNDVHMPVKIQLNWSISSEYILCQTRLLAVHLVNT